MAEKRRRPTRKELDERLHIALDDVPPAIGRDGTNQAAIVAATRTEPRHWTRIVNGTIEAAGDP
jgi:hypothetical protein